jgi:hypothetical protein
MHSNEGNDMQDLIITEMIQSATDRLTSMAEYAEASLSPEMFSWKRMDALRQMLRGEIARLNPEPNSKAENYVATLRSCNRHIDCGLAVQMWKDKHNGEGPGFNFHCHDDECEDCFGC